jgi:predicted transcriptional regulator
MSRAIAPKTTQISIREPDDLLAQIDELAALMQRPRRFVVTEALRAFVTAEVKDARIVAHEVADIEANPDASVPHAEVLDWLIAQGSLRREAGDTEPHGRTVSRSRSTRASVVRPSA